MFKRKNAFTIAEVIIVLTVVGILSAILLPIAFNSTPDDKVLKFKKGNQTLGDVITALTNSKEYYYNGNLGITANGAKVTDKNYFCKTFADILNTKKQNCTAQQPANNEGEYELHSNCDTNKGYLDDICAKYQHEQIVTSEGITYFEAEKDYLFSNTWMQDDFNNDIGKLHKVFCFDVDGINKGEDPFGYGIRADGTILYGRRASVWTKRNIQDSEEDTVSISRPYGTKCAKSPRACYRNSYYDDSSKMCLKCNTKFLNCDTCDKTKCLTCLGGYELASNKLRCYATFCSGENYMKIGNLCWTKRNMGDLVGVKSIPDTVKSVPSYIRCDSFNEKCCWYGDTASPKDCNSDNGPYSGCSRTACNYNAAKEICRMFSGAGKAWRLPTSSELASLNVSTYSKNQKNNGLQLCDNYSGYGSSNCANERICAGSFNDYCYTHRIWSSNLNGSNSTDYRLEQGSWKTSNQPISCPASVRCVSDL